MADDDWKGLVKKDLAELIAEARKQGLWLYQPYQDLWFSPDELQQQNADDKCLWGKVNWRLRNPLIRANDLARRATTTHEELLRFLQRISASAVFEQTPDNPQP